MSQVKPYLGLNRKDRVIANEPIENLKKVHLHEIRKNASTGCGTTFPAKKFWMLLDILGTINAYNMYIACMFYFHPTLVEFRIKFRYVLKQEKYSRKVRFSYQNTKLRDIPGILAFFVMCITRQTFLEHLVKSTTVEARTQRA